MKERDEQRAGREADAAPPEEERSGPAPQRRPEKRYIILAAGLAVLMVLHTLNGHWSSDFWEHDAAVREFAAAGLSPRHPLLDLGQPSDLLTPYTMLAGALSRASGLGPVETLRALALFNLFFLLAGFWRFAASLLERRRAPFYALFFTLFLWGVSPWRWSGFIQLNALGFVLPLPSTFAAGLLFFLLSIYKLLLDHAKRRRLMLLLVPWMTLLLLIHPIVALAMYVGLVCLTFGDADAPAPRPYALLAAMIVLSLALAAAWPYYPLFDLMTRSGVYDCNFLMYDNPLLRTFPAWLGLPAVYGRLKRYRRDPVGLMFLCFLALYLLGAAVRLSALGRTIPYVVLLLHFALADWTAGFEEHLAASGAKARRRLIFYGCLAAVFLAGLVNFRASLVRAAPEGLLPARMRQDSRLRRDYEDFRFLGEFTGRNDVIISDLETSWKIPTFGGRVIAALHPRAFVEDQQERRRDLKRFFESATDNRERLRIIGRYHAGFILLDREKFSGRPAVIDDVRRLGEAIYEDRRFALIEVEPPVPAPAPR